MPRSGVIIGSYDSCLSRCDSGGKTKKWEKTEEKKKEEEKGTISEQRKHNCFCCQLFWGLELKFEAIIGRDKIDEQEKGMRKLDRFCLAPSWGYFEGREWFTFSREPGQRETVDKRFQFLKWEIIANKKKWDIIKEGHRQFFIFLKF